MVGYRWNIRRYIIYSILYLIKVFTCIVFLNNIVLWSFRVVCVVRIMLRHIMNVIKSGYRRWSVISLFFMHLRSKWVYIIKDNVLSPVVAQSHKRVTVNVVDCGHGRGRFLNWY